MTARHIAYTNRAKRELLALSEAMQRRMVAAIDELKSPDVSHKKVKKLKGQKKGESPIYRVRAGNYRAKSPFSSPPWERGHLARSSSVLTRPAGINSP